MSWALFIDESGQDRRNSPYEVLAGVAVEDRMIWRLVRQLSDAQQMIFGTRLFEQDRTEAKATKLLKAKAFKHASQMDPIEQTERARLACEILTDGTNPTRAQLTALGQAKIAYCEKALDLCRTHGGKAFATIVPTEAPRPGEHKLRKDYSYLFERYYAFLNAQDGDPMGYLVFDELDRSASHVLLGQVSEYFLRTNNGRTRSRLVIPEPFFVHSDMTSLVQMADLVAYTISWGLRLHGMTAPRREELNPLAQLVLRMQFRGAADGNYRTNGFKLIRDLRTAEQRAADA